jgi:hypothetical protein
MAEFSYDEYSELIDILNYEIKKRGGSIEIKNVSDKEGILEKIVDVFKEEKAETKEVELDVCGRLSAEEYNEKRETLFNKVLSKK